MSSQLVNSFNNYKAEEVRKNFVINFVRENPGCSIRAIYNSNEGKKLGAAETMKRVIRILCDDDKAIQKLPDKNKNSKRIHLFIVKENPLTSVPHTLSKIQELFEKFCDDLANIYLQDHSKWPSDKYAPIVKPVVVNYRPFSKYGNMPTYDPNPRHTKEVMDFLSFQKKIIRRVIQIPFAVIDVIFGLIKYRQRTQWLGLDGKISSRLNQFLFSKINNLNSIASEMAKKINKEPFNQDLFDEKGEYFITFENTYERYPIFERICIIRHRSNSIGLINQIDSLLNFLITKNNEYFDKRFFLIGSPNWKRLGWPTKSKLQIIHEYHCPGRKTKENESTCHLLNTDPTFRYF